MNKRLFFPLVTMILLACAGLSPRAPATTVPVHEKATPTLPAECVQQNLTPEECANHGTHSYSFKTEFECTNVNWPGTEKFVITFSESSVVLERIEPEKWSHEYTKVSANHYVWKYETQSTGPEQVTVEFNLNGFTLTGTETPECGKYIQTLMP